MNLSEFEKLIKGLSSDEIISAAIDCGFLENRDINRGDELVIPSWLAEILAKRGIVEYMVASI